MVNLGMGHPFIFPSGDCKNSLKEMKDMNSKSRDGRILNDLLFKLRVVKK